MSTSDNALSSPPNAESAALTPQILSPTPTHTAPTQLEPTTNHAQQPSHEHIGAVELRTHQVNYNAAIVEDACKKGETSHVVPQNTILGDSFYETFHISQIHVQRSPMPTNGTTLSNTPTLQPATFPTTSNTNSNNQDLTQPNDLNLSSSAIDTPTLSAQPSTPTSVPPSLHKYLNLPTTAAELPLFADLHLNHNLTENLALLFEVLYQITTSVPGWNTIPFEILLSLLHIEPLAGGLTNLLYTFELRLDMLTNPTLQAQRPETLQFLIDNVQNHLTLKDITVPILKDPLLIKTLSINFDDHLVTKSGANNSGNNSGNLYHYNTFNLGNKTPYRTDSRSILITHNNNNNNTSNNDNNNNTTTNNNHHHSSLIIPITNLSLSDDVLHTLTGTDFVFCPPKVSKVVCRIYGSLEFANRGCELSLAQIASGLNISEELYCTWRHGRITSFLSGTSLNHHQWYNPIISSLAAYQQGCLHAIDNDHFVQQQRDRRVGFEDEDGEEEQDELTLTHPKQSDDALNIEQQGLDQPHNNDDTAKYANNTLFKTLNMWWKKTKNTTLYKNVTNHHMQDKMSSQRAELVDIDSVVLPCDGEFGELHNNSINDNNNNNSNNNNDNNNNHRVSSIFNLFSDPTNNLYLITRPTDALSIQTNEIRLKSIVLPLPPQLEHILLPLFNSYQLRSDDELLQWDEHYHDELKQMHCVKSELLTLKDQGNHNNQTNTSITNNNTSTVNNSNNPAYTTTKYNVPLKYHHLTNYNPKNRQPSLAEAELLVEWLDIDQWQYEIDWLLQHCVLFPLVTAHCDYHNANVLLLDQPVQHNDDNNDEKVLSPEETKNNDNNNNNNHNNNLNNYINAHLAPTLLPSQPFELPNTIFNYLKTIDFEYGMYTFQGYDMANSLNETFCYYDGDYPCFAYDLPITLTTHLLGVESCGEENQKKEEKEKEKEDEKQSISYDYYNTTLDHEYINTFIHNHTNQRGPTQSEEKPTTSYDYLQQMYTQWNEKDSDFISNNIQHVLLGCHSNKPFTPPPCQIPTKSAFRPREVLWGESLLTGYYHTLLKENNIKEYDQTPLDQLSCPDNYANTPRFDIYPYKTHLLDRTTVLKNVSEEKYQQKMSYQLPQNIHVFLHEMLPDLLYEAMVLQLASYLQWGLWGVIMTETKYSELNKQAQQRRQVELQLERAKNNNNNSNDDEDDTKTIILEDISAEDHSSSHGYGYLEHGIVRLFAYVVKKELLVKLNLLQKQ